MEAIQKELQIHVLLCDIDSIMNPKQFLRCFVYTKFRSALILMSVILHTRVCILYIAGSLTTLSHQQNMWKCFCEAVKHNTHNIQFCGGWNINNPTAIKFTAPRATILTNIYCCPYYYAASTFAHSHQQDQNKVLIL